MDSKQYETKFLALFGCFADEQWYNKTPCSDGIASKNQIPPLHAFANAKDGAGWLHMNAEGPWWLFEYWFSAESLAQFILNFWSELSPTNAERKEAPVT